MVACFRRRRFFRFLLRLFLVVAGTYDNRQEGNDQQATIFTMRFHIIWCYWYNSLVE